MPTVGWYSERKDLNALPQKEREEEGGWRGREGHNQGMSVASSMAAGEAGALARQRSRGESACVSIPSTARFLFSRALWRSVISRSAMSSLRHSIPRVVSARASIVPPMPAMEDAIQHEERAGAACRRKVRFLILKRVLSDMSFAGIRAKLALTGTTPPPRASHHANTYS